MKNAQNIVAILSRQSFHAERKKSVATTIHLSHLEKEGAQDLQVVTDNGIPTVKPEKNSNFLKNGKMVISVKIQKISRSQMTKRTSPLELSHEI